MTTGDDLPAVVVRPNPGALVTLAASLDDLVKANRAYHEAVSRLLDADDYVTVSGRTFKKRSAWNKLALAFGVSAELRSSEIERDEYGKIQRATVTVRASHPAGRFADGIGVCDRDERAFAHYEHDLVATAYTRASNRAKADLFGSGEVSAEEMDAASDERPTAKNTGPKMATAAQVALIERLTSELDFDFDGHPAELEFVQARAVIDALKEKARERAQDADE